MAASVVFEEQLEIPLNLQTLEDFRQWALSDSFPDRGRIDFIAGRIEVDMSPEDIYCHGTLKTELIGVLFQRVKQGKLGNLLSDRTRISSLEADLSVEPDIVFVFHQAISEGRIPSVPLFPRFVPGDIDHRKPMKPEIPLHPAEPARTFLCRGNESEKAIRHPARQPARTLEPPLCNMQQEAGGYLCSRNCR